MKGAITELSSTTRTNINRGQTSIGRLALLRFITRTGSNHRKKINKIGKPENGATIAPVRLVNNGKVVRGSPISAIAHKISRKMK
jgi:hypothetical protein